MKIKLTFPGILAILMMCNLLVNAQGVSINENGADPDASAMMDIQSTTKGLLIPRMNFAEMFTINNPAIGLLVYCTTDNNFYFYKGGTWDKVVGSADDDWTLDGNDMYSNNTGLIGIGTTTTLPTHKLTIENASNGNLLRLIGPGSYGETAKLNFGDGNYVYLEEFFDDMLAINASSGLGLYSNQDIGIQSNYSNINLYTSNGGVAINDFPAAPDPSAILDVSSSTKGLLIPRMTASQIAAISSPTDGLQAYNLDDGSLYIFVESAGVWKQVSYGSGTIVIPIPGCGDPLVDSRDGQSYNTVQINDQCWMAENLNYGTMVYSGANQYNNSTVEKYCYNNSTSYCDNLGGLYQWNEMMDYTTTPGGQGICPDGWHVPTDAEWYAMENFLDPSVYSGSTGWRGNVVGQKLKSTATGGSYNWPSNPGTNTSGFTALPGGVRNTSGSTSGNPTNGAFWTSTPSGSYAYYREMYYGYNTVYRTSIPNIFGFSVRCVKD